MKKILLSFALLGSLLFSLPGTTADRSLPDTAVQVSLSETQTPLPTPQVQLAVLSDARSVRGTPVRDLVRPANVVSSAASSAAVIVADKPPVDGLPSTPIALACLLLIMCILVGRRNSGDRIE